MRVKHHSGRVKHLRGGSCGEAATAPEASHLRTPRRLSDTQPLSDMSGAPRSWVPSSTVAMPCVVSGNGVIPGWKAPASGEAVGGGLAALASAPEHLCPTGTCLFRVVSGTPQGAHGG